MTQANPRPDEDPTPPTSTSWSDEEAEHDDELAPPFVPSGAQPAPEATEPAPPFEPEPTEPEHEPTAAEPVEAGPEPEPTEPEPEPEPAGVPAWEDAFPFEGGWDEEEAQAGADEARAVDDSTPEAFDTEDGEGTASAVEPAMEETDEAGPAFDPAGSLADRLEEMADRLRADGPAAAEAGMDSSDRFTALLAGLLAGYLAGQK